MGTVTQVCMLERKEFTWAEANELLPVVKRIFEKHEKVIKKALNDQRFYISSFAPQSVITKQDNLVAEEMRQCGIKLHKLGLKVLGNGYVGFDSGVFYWSYLSGDKEINHYHGYGESPFDRKEIKILYPTYVQE